MRALVVVVVVAGCAEVYEGEHATTVSTTIELTAPVAGVESSETVEQLAILEGDMSRNAMVVRRRWPGEIDCDLRAFKRGGFGLSFEPGHACTRAGDTWTVVAGSAPNEDHDELVIDLAWAISGPREGTATETLRLRP